MQGCKWLSFGLLRPAVRKGTFGAERSRANFDRYSIVNGPTRHCVARMSEAQSRASARRIPDFAALHPGYTQTHVIAPCFVRPQGLPLFFLPSAPKQLWRSRPVIGRPQGWRCAPPPSAADGLDPARSLVFEDCHALGRRPSAFGGARSAHCVSARSHFCRRAIMTLRMPISLRLQATSATFGSLPLAIRRR